MNKKVERNYLEISFLEDLRDSTNFSDHYSINLVEPVDFQLNKFFYKNIGKSHHWVDRLVWDEKQWLDYVSDKKVKTYVLKDKDELAGYFELILHTPPGLLDDLISFRESISRYFLSTLVITKPFFQLFLLQINGNEGGVLLDRHVHLYLLMLYILYLYQLKYQVSWLLY